MARSTKPDGAAKRAAALKMQRYRKRMRAAGLRPVQIWVPDVRSPAVRKEIRRQSRLVAKHASEAEALAFLDAAYQDLLDEDQ
jgi:hypothetical protein